MDITKLLPKAVKHAESIEVGSNIPNQNTLRNYLTDFETKMYLRDTLMFNADKKNQGPWKEYRKFYLENESGDMNSFSKDHKKKVDDMIKALETQYAKDLLE